MMHSASFLTTGAMPLTDPAFRQAIDDLAVLAGAIVDAVATPLLGLSVAAGRVEEGPFPVWPEFVFAAPGAALAPCRPALLAPVAEALRRAAADLAERLVGGWSGVAGDALTIVTDGEGVALCRHAAGAETLSDDPVTVVRDATVLRAFPESGPWGLIADHTASGTLH